METAEFEEKEFETPLNQQLLGGSHLVWSPGQVLEKQMGFDAALFAGNDEFWRAMGFNSPPRGVQLFRYNINHIWTRKKHNRALPTFHLNLFVQAKRPKYYQTPPKGQLKKGVPNKATWQFEITRHQQQALQKLTQRLRKRVLVVYASPAFHRFSDLDAHIKGNTLIQNSTFPSAVRLRGHKKWAYQNPGSDGWALSEPERVKEDSLSSRIETLISEYSQNERPSQIQGIDDSLQSLARATVKAMKELSRFKNPRAIAFLEAAPSLPELSSRTTYNWDDNVQSFQTVLLFCTFFDLNWHVIGKGI